MNIATSQPNKKNIVINKSRSYNEVVEYLSSKWSNIPDTTLERMKLLDNALGNPSKKVDTVIVAGTNGKSSTIYFTAQLLKEDGYKVGCYYAPHFLTYNERFSINQNYISNKTFTEIANDVINTAESLSITAHTSELLTAIALNYFVQEGVEVALLEADKGGAGNPVSICSPCVAAITRVTSPASTTTEDELTALVHNIMGIAQKGTYVVAGDQSKAHLQLMETLAGEKGAQWAMPIRKLAALPYPYEQLHGRCAALAERIGQLFSQKKNPAQEPENNRLLFREEKRRGRPTIEARREANMHPKKTLSQFWKETINQLPAHFQLFDKEKPSILLDNAHNLDAFNNLLLGIRLLHYQRPLKGLTLIMSATEGSLHSEEFIKAIRYFFKKTAGQIFICPLSKTNLEANELISWDIEQVTNDLKSLKVKAKAFSTFIEAFEAAKASVDERNGLVVITGSQTIISEYWSYKGLKKLI